MKIKLLVASIVIAGFTSSTLAATTYYVVQNNKTHKCSVRTNKPSATSKTLVLVADAAGYKTKQEATDAMGAADACKAAT
jgi:hypothetical protein